MLTHYSCVKMQGIELCQYARVTVTIAEKRRVVLLVDLPRERFEMQPVTQTNRPSPPTEKILQKISNLNDAFERVIGILVN